MHNIYYLRLSGERSLPFGLLVVKSWNAHFAILLIFETVSVPKNMITTFTFGLKIGNFLPFADKNMLKFVFSPHHSLAKGSNILQREAI